MTSVFLMLHVREVELLAGALKAEADEARREEQHESADLIEARRFELERMVRRAR